MNVTINGNPNNNNTGSSISNGNKGDITVSNGADTWTINNLQLSTKFIYGEVPNGLINGNNSNFTSKDPFIPETLSVYINGLRQAIIKDYITTGTTQVLLFDSLQTTDSITINYIRAQ